MPNVGPDFFHDSPRALGLPNHQPSLALNNIITIVNKGEEL